MHITSMVDCTNKSVVVLPTHEGMILARNPAADLHGVLFTVKPDAVKH
jgi:hypothetical protein